MMDDQDSKQGVKRKKEELNAESFDNNASVKKIVDLIETKNRRNKVYEYYCQTMRQRRDHLGKNMWMPHHLYTGHPLYAFSDEWDGGLNSGYFETFSHKSLQPKFISRIYNIEKNDPVTDILKKKLDYYNDWGVYKRVFSLTGKRHSYEWLDDDVIYCPKLFVDLAAKWDNRPDQFIDSSYNWYYAGHGNMQLIRMNGADYMLHSEFSCVYLSPFTNSTVTMDYENTVSFDCGEGTDILETVSSLNIVALRSRTKIIILELTNSEDGIKIQKLKEIESELPYTRISFDEFHKNILYATTIDYRLSIINLDRMAQRSKTLRGKIKTLVDNWNCVIGSQRGYYTHVTKTSITLYDKRTNEPFQRWKRLKKITDSDACDSITAATYVKDKPLLYIGTDRHLFLMDLRYQSNEKLKAVQRWTHGMKCPPTYMKICNFGFNKELICLSSQWCEDMCVISNFSGTLTIDSHIPSVVMPYRPPSVFQTFQAAQLKRLCYDFYDPIEPRLTMAITGLSVVENGDNYNVLMQNSLGDISNHCLYPKYMESSIVDDGIQNLHDWSKGYKREKKDLLVTSILDITEVWRRLKRIPDTYKLGQSIFSRHKSKFKEEDVYDAFEKDELDSGLLDIWMKDGNKDISMDQTIDISIDQTKDISMDQTRDISIDQTKDISMDQTKDISMHRMNDTSIFFVDDG